MDPWWEDERDQELPVAVPHTELSPEARGFFPEMKSHETGAASYLKLIGGNFLRVFERTTGAG